MFEVTVRTRNHLGYFYKSIFAFMQCDFLFMLLVFNICKKYLFVHIINYPPFYDIEDLRKKEVKDS